LEGECGGECSVLLFVVGVIAAVLGGLVVGLFSGLIYVLSTVNKRSDNEFNKTNILGQTPKTYNFHLLFLLHALTQPLDSASRITIIASCSSICFVF
jgi:hypothetical protein